MKPINHVPCPVCRGTGETDPFERIILELSKEDPCYHCKGTGKDPKVQVLIDACDEINEIGSEAILHGCKNTDLFEMNSLAYSALKQLEQE